MPRSTIMRPNAIAIGHPEAIAKYVDIAAYTDYVTLR